MTESSEAISSGQALNPADPLLSWSLYDAYAHEEYSRTSLTKFKSRNFQIDAYCIDCESILPFKTRRSTGSGASGSMRAAPGRPVKKNAHFPNGVFKVDIYCGRCNIAYEYFFKVTDEQVMKIGQFPSIADISNSETAQYRKLMSNEDASEFYKAVGLAAHGVGIGSYAYLRRIFERLIYGRFEAKKNTEGWVEEDFKKMRMDDKIGFLKNYIPDFLFQNRKIYSVLSKGLHEMSEEECLRFFDVLKSSIIVILEEDKREEEERKSRESLSAAIKKL